MYAALREYVGNVGHGKSMAWVLGKGGGGCSPPTLPRSALENVIRRHEFELEKLFRYLSYLYPFVGGEDIVGLLLLFLNVGKTLIEG